MLLIASIIQFSWPGYLFQIIGIIFFGVGLYFLRFVRQRINGAHQTTGVLVDYYQKKGRNLSHWPIIEFKNRAGDLVRGKSYSGWSIRFHKIGSELPIYFYQSKGGTAYEIVIKKFLWTYALPLYIIVVSIIAFLLPVFFDFPT